MTYGWCHWFQATGKHVRHKRTGTVGEIVNRAENGDVHVRIDGGGVVYWFRENVEPADQDGR